MKAAQDRMPRIESRGPDNSDNHQVEMNFLVRRDGNGLRVGVRFSHRRSSSYTLVTLQVRFLLRVLHFVEVYVIQEEEEWSNG